MNLVERRVPSVEVGEYCEWEDRKGKYLFPLAEEGSYGPLPQYKYPGKWMEPPGYTRRDKKPKVYASYAINSDCAFHGPKLERYDREVSPRKTPPRATPPKSIMAAVNRPKRATSLPPEINMSTGPVSPVPTPPARATSCVPQPITPSIDFEMDLSEMTGRLMVSRAISQDYQDSLLDKSLDDEEDEPASTGSAND